MNAVAIIPARGGSKRLPRKNVIDFLGKPIIAYTIDAACKSGCFERVVVSTEDNEIAEIAASCGAVVHRRAATLATDTARVVDVCVDVLRSEAADGRKWDLMACLYATAPLRSAADIAATVALLKPGVCDFAMAVTSYDLSPHHALEIAPDGRLEPAFPDRINRHEHELPPLRVDNGSTYAVVVAAFLRHRTFYGPSLFGYDMPRERSSDIDTSDDYELALWRSRQALEGERERAAGSG